mmetsp:Transcript_74407/g.241604  ORF Transcript_74407/g.241604 Transcript_74407/m.241604 type:complete len:286 (-) Transcript_74407:113-970(-)
MERLHSKEQMVPIIWGGPNEGMESKAQLLNRVRRKLGAAGIRGGKTWEDLFNVSDLNRDGHLNFLEFMNFIRKELSVHSATCCDYELRMLFNEIDRNVTNSVDSAELIEYMQHGARRPQDDVARVDDRINRVRRNMRLAFQAIGGNELDARMIFTHMDMDASMRLTKYEFSNFVRNDLGLTRWDVQNSALMDFYEHIDPNGDGIDMTELLTFLRQQHREKNLVGPQALYVTPKNIPKIDKKRKTHKQRLTDGFPRNALPRGNSLPSLFTHSFTALGRDSPAMRRL